MKSKGKMTDQNLFQQKFDYLDRTFPRPLGQGEFYKREALTRYCTLTFISKGQNIKNSRQATLKCDLSLENSGQRPWFLK